MAFRSDHRCRGSHTADKQAAVRCALSQGQTRGQLFFYLYPKDGAARHLCDSHIRGPLHKLPPRSATPRCEGS